MHLPDESIPRTKNLPPVLEKQLNFDREKLAEEAKEEVQKLNQEQLTIVLKILEKFHNGEGGAFFIDAPGGTGKKKKKKATMNFHIFF